MFLSIFDIFKVSVGPSSSHTMGPMLAAGRFLDQVVGSELPAGPLTLGCRLYGSLAYTGEGHGTVRAVLCGLMGMRPESYDREAATIALDELASNGAVRLRNGRVVGLDPRTAVALAKGERLPAHPNGMTFSVRAGNTEVLAESYYSVGGGFVLTAAEMEAGPGKPQDQDVPYPFGTAVEMLAMGEDSGLSIAAMKGANEVARGTDDLDGRIMAIWDVMNRCIDRGLSTGGTLPGGLNVKRRAMGLNEKLTARAGANDAPLHSAVDWLQAYAMAVNEENAAGGQVVTAPTNGAAGVIPAVIRYYLDLVPGASPARVPEMLLTAAAIGGLIKYNASISGAEVGCQGEVGSASAMAAAALCAVLGGTNAQIENAAEIALEHHLGMTCDPIRGLVQVPCIERNGMGSVKAVAAASLAMLGDGQHIVPLDAAIETMRQTGRDMDERYKETSLGGLSVSLPEC
ncbi:MAG: L-serine ammonia-lyase [Devosia sp.]|uniref:L-serine ammonia-lyase n=1 Tax=Devosia sp. 66-22 TaxID=1895753 RepID=UPI000929AC57|nr:L-serine ammonia-lyase [Devosia sp. 66-22]MBN9345995.1 L-serine ammonia-lyase [Devosia sp.]OJX53063.1 MAG: L-serine ammonia-lyase [Devosia sp. 66-22]